ncbi:MAG: TAT-variant-translocated molybdopterin oxidoreductase, partial [Flavobacteriales bacterium]
MSDKKKYWKGLEEKNMTENFIAQHEKEFPEEIPVDEFLGNEDLDSGEATRRDFLKFLGFSVTAASLASCETPVNKVIPYVNKPEDVNPGIANWYASTYYDGEDYASILVKTREGRPIHIKGNKHFGLNKGGINPRINSSLLSLYDSERLKAPYKDGGETSWDIVDENIRKQMDKISSKHGKIRILSNTLISPSENEAINAFRNEF